VNTNRELPDEAVRYLKSLHRSLAALPRADREELAEGVEGHIRDALTSGDRTVGEVLSDLGPPQEIAAPALEEFERRNGKFRRPSWAVPRTAQVAALVFVIAATLAALLLPTGVSVTQISDGDKVVETPTLLQMNAPTILIPMAIPFVLTLIPLLTPPHRWRLISSACAGLLAVFVVIASASIGWLYAPALLAGLVAVLYRPK
jgi:hypothetical protein